MDQCCRSQPPWPGISLLPNLLWIFGLERSNLTRRLGVPASQDCALDDKNLEIQISDAHLDWTFLFWCFRFTERVYKRWFFVQRTINNLCEKTKGCRPRRQRPRRSPPPWSTPLIVSPFRLQNMMMMDDDDWCGKFESCSRAQKMTSHMQTWVEARQWVESHFHVSVAKWFLGESGWKCPLYFKHMNRWMDGLPGWKTVVYTVFICICFSLCWAGMVRYLLLVWGCSHMQSPLYQSVTQ